MAEALKAGVNVRTEKLVGKKLGLTKKKTKREAKVSEKREHWGRTRDQG